MKVRARLLLLWTPVILFAASSTSDAQIDPRELLESEPEAGWTRIGSSFA